MSRVQQLRRLFPVRVIEHTLHDDATVVAGGIALFLLLGLLPLLASVVSIYALIADPGSIESHLEGLERVVPRAVFDLLVEQLQRAARRSSDELGLAFATSTFLALYSTRSSAGAILTGIEHVDGSPPQWTSWRRLVLTLLLAFGGLIASLTMLFMVVTLPATASALNPTVSYWLFELRWPVLLVLGVFSLTGLYRLGGGHRKLRHIVPGAITATVLALVASFGVSWYVTTWSSYQDLYGAFGGAMIVLLWFYAVSLSVLMGAVVNVELRRPSSHATTPPPRPAIKD